LPSRRGTSLRDCLLHPAGRGSEVPLAGARKMLETANADGDHEQANALLNIIGKLSHLAA